MIDTSKILNIKGALLLVVVSLSTQAALAAPRVDYFAATGDQKVNSTPSNTAGTLPNASSTKDQQSPVTIWFANFDELREKYKPSDSDKIILARPLNQDAERVASWTRTAEKISSNYLTLAKILRSTPVPPGSGSLKEYRDLTADWYEDSAGVYQDMIRPRKPAKTIEELQESLDAIKKRSQSLVRTRDDLRTMDKSLRNSLHVSGITQVGTTKQFAQRQ